MATNEILPNCSNPEEMVEWMHNLSRIEQINIFLREENERLKNLRIPEELTRRLDDIQSSLVELREFIMNKRRTETSKKRINSVSHRLRIKILERDNYTCKNCNKSGKDIKLHIDHIIPRSKGGTNETDNLQTLCKECNLLKKDYEFSQLREVKENVH